MKRAREISTRAYNLNSCSLRGCVLAVRAIEGKAFMWRLRLGSEVAKGEVMLGDGKYIGQNPICSFGDRILIRGAGRGAPGPT